MRRCIPEMMLAVSDVVVTGLYVALTGLTIAFTNVLVGWLASRKVEAVKVAMDTNTAATAIKLDGIATVGKKTHTLVNSNMALQLKISMVALRRLADITKHPDDVAAATFAEKSYREHESKQAIVDQDEAKEPSPSST